MIHYVVLMEKSKFLSGTFYSNYLYKKAEGNELPDFPTVERLTRKQFKGMLIVHGFSETLPLTIEEISLQNVAEISILFFDFNGNFERKEFYQRMPA